MSQEERRYAAGTVEHRRSDDGKHVAVGYAAVFGRRSHDLGGFTEMIDPAAFTKTVSEADVIAAWNHNEDRLLGRVTSGTLRLAVDERGLHYEIDMPDSEAGIVELLSRGDIRGSSFGFRTIRDRWEQDDKGVVTRHLLEVALIDVSPVARPAYPDTTSALRSLAAQTRHELREVREAAEARNLATILTPDEGAESHDPPPPATPVVSASIEWLYA